jgi:DNA ligase-1
MSELHDGETARMQGSGREPYILKNVGGVYSCSCPAWRNQSLPIEQRTCKHLIRLRGKKAEAERTGGTVPAPTTASAISKKAAPALLLAETWDSASDPTDWWLSEKLDGVRAYWTGKQFLSRQGNVLRAPEWFTKRLPSIPLDGELWLARKAFQRTVSIVRRHDDTELWREIKFRIFDAPALDDPFEARIEYLCESFSRLRLPYAGILPQQRCRGIEHLHDELMQIIAQGGEGLMLREPGSRYEPGRSNTLLKVKQFQDAEARVIGHQAGKGRHKGRLGALVAELPDGTTFSVGTGFSDAQREMPPPIGSTITFRYQELTDRGVPRFPSFVRVLSEVDAASR